MKRSTHFSDKYSTSTKGNIVVLITIVVVVVVVFFYVVVDVVGDVVTAVVFVFYVLNTSISINVFIQSRRV